MSCTNKLNAISKSLIIISNMDNSICQYAAPSLPSVSINPNGFWGNRTKCIREQTIPAIVHSLRSSGRVDAMKWKPGDDKIPAHPFWDSDIYKTLEACCYLLIKEEDAFIREFVEESVKTIQNAQLEDGCVCRHSLIIN
jgi:DUF1680 family protein